MAAVVSEQMVDPAPTSAPPAAQSMDNHNSSRRFSGDSPEALDPSLTSSAPSPSTQLDSQTQSPSRVEEYRQLFRLPPDEVLIQDFNCALQEFLLQGHMYLFVHYICFYSNLFGFETKKIISFHEITSVRRAKAVAVFPTAIEIMAGGKKYFFTSFLFRDEAFKLISEGWLQHGNGSKEITEQQVQVEEFFNLFFSDAGVNFQESFHRKCGDKEFKCTPWHPHEKFGHTRDVSFQHPIKLYFGSRFGSCQEWVTILSSSLALVELGKVHCLVPSVARWVENDGNDSKPGCILRVYINVAFSKKTMWKVDICGGILFCTEAHEVLKQKNLEKEEASQHSAICGIQDNRCGISQITPEVKDMNQRVHAPPQGNASEASVGSLFRETFAKFATSFKHQSSSSLFMVITIAIILLLMQISILVLLSRPQRIHVIPQADCMSSVRGLTENRGKHLPP
ncbi:protein VASCULAR ASSOCIATED DEATH 1, chloroplastic [Sesamum angolense]|uniref:Protein VASCULAR ASSOCIATED DEATH 1, chloroplastic n=1 Tax=Sesamum angolense TaxID=2727404 RepID=A0AAE1XGX5_9LAMI|nr:protein VASCULAR ASSOCIATED DEATH 1, chloroplastic [Sesamum angolense]